MRKIQLTQEQIDKIIELHRLGKSRKQIMKTLNLSEKPIRNIINNYSGERMYHRIGERYGRLTILEKIGTAKNGSPIVRCLCDCGTIKDFNIGNITYPNMKGTKSCGCYKKDVHASKNPWLTEYNSYIGNTVKKRKLLFKLNIDEFKKLCSSICFYCGSDPQSKMDVGNNLRNGIDRVDNSIGYEIDNCVPCCWQCNRMKSNMFHKDFLSHIKKIYKWIS